MRSFGPLLAISSLLAPSACFRHLDAGACDGPDRSACVPTAASSSPASSSSEVGSSSESSSSTSTTTLSGTTSSDDGTSSTTDDATTSTTTAPDTTTGPTPFCGDGIVQPDEGEECDGDEACNFVCRRDRVVFVSSPPFFNAGDLKGLEGADNYCRSRAGMAGLPQFIKFKAFLSDSQHDAATRLFNGQGRYVLVDGTVVTDDWISLLTKPLQHPIDMTETGEHLINGVWTGTEYGTGKLVPGADNCADWTSNDPQGQAYFGAAGAVDENWVHLQTNNPESCIGGFAIYCIEQK